MALFQYSGQKKKIYASIRGNFFVKYCVSLILAKISPVSHSKERHEKICLNCNATLNGRFCHACGQENIEPRDSVWGLITHFFNDITHFDGKFFSTARMLITRPGVLPREYMAGRRASYLHPIRMYVFTSAVFFLVFFSVFHIHDLDVMDDVKGVTQVATLNVDSLQRTALQGADTREDSADIREAMDVLRGLNAGKPENNDEETNKSKEEEKPAIPAAGEKAASQKTIVEKDSVATPVSTGNYRYRGTTVQLRDSTLSKTLVKDPRKTKEINQAGKAADSSQSVTTTVKTPAEKKKKKNKWSYNFASAGYKSNEEYDSVQRSLPADERDGWLARRMTYRNIAIENKYHGNEEKLIEDLINKFLHTFPYLLFVSLPLYALYLKLLYVRRGQYYYVDHVMFLIFLYIFTFVFLLVFIGVDKIRQAIPVQVGLGWLEGLMALAGFYYGYKAMRNFYRQGRGKTLFKFILFNILCSITIWLLFGLFFALAVFQI